MQTFRGKAQALVCIPHEKEFEVEASTVEEAEDLIRKRAQGNLESGVSDGWSPVQHPDSFKQTNVDPDAIHIYDVTHT